MKMKNFIPEGVEDIDYKKFQQIEVIRKKVEKVFKSEGYKQISTPTFEYYDLFSGIDMSIDKDEMYKIIDSNGKILVLRPDATIPIARMVATNHKYLNGNIKLMYLTNVFRSSDFRALGKREFIQAGVEYFGNPSLEADAQVIETSIKALVESGFKQIRIELGDAKFFDGLVDELSDTIDKNTKNAIRKLIESKNYPELSVMLDGMNIDLAHKKILLELPFLYGEFNSIINRAKDLAINEKMLSAVNDLTEIYSIIKANSLDEYIFLDLGLVNHLNYYSGMMFKIYLQNTGKIAGGGGRYDGLMEKFGKKIPAIGFGLNMDVLYEAKGISNKADGTISIAIGKGRLAEFAITKLNEMGIIFPDYKKESRKLIFFDSTGKIKIIFVKSQDVDIYVEKGACDLGVSGKDVISENNSDIYEIIDLKFGICKFAVAAPKGFKMVPHKKIRVATKYPNVAKAFYEKKGEPIEIIKINGSVELAPIVGLSDVIVDIVQSGKTLKENGLEIIEDISYVSARLIANKVSLKTKQEEMTKIISSFRRII
jgi:ATP phosphoribosyltransferase